ncbi:hypothetical protein [Streptomyces sp. UG1]|uniref:hypothetical protein n=1 Tax=Streptomyces sp. UG1 TaxID=3417652 RepID=UPI003CF0ED5C
MGYKALRIDPDGTRTYLDLPDELLDAVREQVGGDLEFAHYGRVLNGTLLAVAVVVYEYSLDEHPANIHATRAVEAVRGAALSYLLHGPVVFLGWDGRENVLSLPEAVRPYLLAGSAS